MKYMKWILDWSCSHNFHRDFEDALCGPRRWQPEASLRRGIDRFSATECKKAQCISHVPLGDGWINRWYRMYIIGFTIFHIYFTFISLCFIILHYLSLCFSIFHYMSLYFIMFHYISLWRIHPGLIDVKTSIAIFFGIVSGLVISAILNPVKWC